MKCMQNILHVSKSLIQNLIDHLDKNIIAVGTTSLRTLESLYWLGVKTVDSQQSTVHGNYYNGKFMIIMKKIFLQKKH